MRFSSISPLVLLYLSSLCGQEVRRISTAHELQDLFRNPVDSIRVELAPGTYHLVPTHFIDESCGNCEGPPTSVHATVGLHIRGRSVVISGPPNRSATIHTHAGYGIFIEDCNEAILENLTITGGERDTSGMATDAAVVVRRSSAVVRNNRIVGNIGDSALVTKRIVGIIGIAGREHSTMTIVNNEIVRNSWDGIALYRDARASIEGNIIDGIDKATGGDIGGGRGVGIGLSWNAAADIRRNLVKRYWKGIGIFVDARATVRENIVEDIVTWGIQLWDAERGIPSAHIEQNVIYNTGACGAAITRASEQGDPGSFRGNILTKTAQNPRYDSPDYYCTQCALALERIPPNFLIADNVFTNNRRATPDLPDADIPIEAFRTAIRPRMSLLESDRILKSSDFVRDFR
ncbi:MAG: right-handed parallel beta-helix repeat-containing protein [Ignavibacteria bacterium]|nr:right-handed parallel beta-helix repeat-containing protein [Ignavibacteria bacterium]